MNDTETIKSLEKTSFDSLFIAFDEAFSNYNIQLSKEELRIMLNRRGFIPKLSFGAFENDKLIAFTLNGIGMFNGVKTAYDTGTGTLKDYRGRGIASKIFTYSLPFLKNAGISQYLLEVLQDNAKAISVYKNLGFTVTREFNYFKQNNIKIKLLPKTLHTKHYIQEITLDYKDQMMKFWDFIPSWQNSFEAILRSVKDYKILGVFELQKLIAYCIFEPVSGDITQISVAKEYRRQGIASTLLKEMLKYNQHDSVKVINTETTCSTIIAFLASNGIPLTGKQFEMIKKI